MGHSPPPRTSRYNRPALSTPPSILPPPRASPPLLPKVLGARRAEQQACMAQVLCQPICRFHGVYGLESHMAVGPAGASTPHLSPRAEPDSQTHLPPQRATCFPPLGPIVPAAATPTGSQARAPIARIRTLALPLHPAVDPAPPPPSAAAARPAQSRLSQHSNCFRVWRKTASWRKGSPRRAQLRHYLFQRHCGVYHRVPAVGGDAQKETPF